MSMSDAGRQTYLAPIGVMVLRLVSSGLRDRKPEDRFLEDLERIAASAPHLLSDIGLERDPGMSSPAETVWCKGSLRVAISSRDGSVSVLRR